MNEIREIKNLAVDGPSGPASAIMIALNMDTPDQTGQFVTDLVERFKAHRMISPPDTSLLLVTVIGKFDGPAFLSAWRERVQLDPVVRAFLSQMEIATCIHGTASGKAIDEFSLII